MERNYQNGKIYCIRNNNDDDIYVGSTTQSLSRRMSKHRTDMNNPELGASKLYIKMRDLGKEAFYIELLEEVKCDNVEQLRKREGELIRQMATLNHNIAGRSEKEWYNDNRDNMLVKNKVYYQEHKKEIKERTKQYYEEHKEEVKEYYKRYNEENQERLREQRKQYYEEHNEQLREQKKQYYKEHKEDMKKNRNKYYQDNKQRINKLRQASVRCICGSVFRQVDQARHERSKKHQEFINQENQ